MDGRLSRTSSTEKESLGESDSKKTSDENKENCRLDQYMSDQDSWNESVISGNDGEIGSEDELQSCCCNFQLPNSICSGGLIPGHLTVTGSETAGLQH
ncbi:hypothetical protein ILYODFUR_038044 [Ilyodon furcidens]|uniref:Uncharacterized protein n=1 Tax=Ilyodon furcidens TaxID=33524 RepID=A0ABV0TIH1_9TELE